MQSSVIELAMKEYGSKFNPNAEALREMLINEYRVSESALTFDDGCEESSFLVGDQLIASQGDGGGIYWIFIPGNPEEDSVALGETKSLWELGEKLIEMW